MKFLASHESSGVKNPNFEEICHAYNIKYLRLNSPSDLQNSLQYKGPLFIDFHCDPMDYIGPRLMPSETIDDEHLNMYPYLDKFNSSQLI